MITQPDNSYQNALLKRLNPNRPTQPDAGMFQPVGGYQAPVDPVTTPIEAPAPSAPMGGGSLQDILGKYQYGAKGLADAEQELTGAGYQLQKDSGGRVRGRLKGPTGDIIDVIGQGEGNDWWNNQTGSAWNIHNRGQEGLDAGGWSFGGANSSGGPSMPTPVQPPTVNAPELDSPIFTQGDTQSPYLAALLAQLGL